MTSALSSYNNDRPPLASSEVEYPADPASGAFFQPEFKKHDDLKQMLDSTKDSLKLEAMKRIIGMIAKGRDGSDLFPAVVKNVVSKNIEVKKLVYVYLVRYAEEQQDLALLSISTFQRALKDPNQLIRASALRVLSSIRVNMIVPIVMLAIRDSVSDMSPYVRKTAAHAIPKLYSLDPEQKEELVNIIDKLLCDRTPLVVGSAAMAFSEVCPERTDLLHHSFRKLCSMLADVDEWGQIVLLGVMTRYAREHFCDPNSEGVHSEDEKQRPFYEDSEATDSAASDTDSNSKGKMRSAVPVSAAPLDADHRLLLRTAKPLLQSRNASVVMAVAQLFYHAGPGAELSQAGKSLVRLLRGPTEVQSVVLHSIASLTIAKKSMFEPHLKSFFVRNCDPTHIKLLKLEILTNLATETSVPVVLRELQTYVSSSDKAFVAAAIQAIGRLAANIDQVTDTCLNGLLHLLSSKDESVVGEAVVVVKRVLHGGQEDNNSSSALVSRAARLLRAGRVTAPGARAAAAWLLAEHGARTSHAPSALAHMLTTFTEEDDVVKLQILTLAVKLSICRPETLPLAAHALNLAKYDQSYDVRDRARLLRKFVISENGQKSRLMANAAYVLLAEKPAPIMESKFKDRQHLTLGTLSHYVGTTTPGYVSLPAFPESAAPSSLRDPPTTQVDTVEVLIGKREKGNKSVSGKKESFFYASESSYGEFSSGDEGQSSDESEEKIKHKSKANPTNSNSSGRSSQAASEVGSEDESEGSSSGSESDSESVSSSEEDSGSDESDQTVPHKTAVKKPKEDKTTPRTEEQIPTEDVQKAKEKDKSNLDLLLELDDAAGALPLMTPSMGGFLSPLIGNNLQSDDTITTVSPSFVPMASHELLSKITGRGLSVLYRYTRAPHLFSPKMATVELTLANQSSDEIKNIRISQKNISSDQSIHEFNPITELPPGAVVQKTIGIDFADTTQPISFHIATELIEAQVTIKPPVGELIRSVTMSDLRFQNEQKRLRGMTQVEGKGALPGNASNVSLRIFEVANLAQNASQGSMLRYAGQLLSSQCLVLVSVQINDGDTNITVNCDKMAIGSMLLNDIKSVLSR